MQQELCGRNNFFINNTITFLLKQKKRVTISDDSFVDNSIEISNISLTPRDFEQTNYLIKKLISKDYL